MRALVKPASRRPLTAAILTLTTFFSYGPQPAAADRGAGVPPRVRFDNAATIVWEPCPEDETVQCGTMRVPVDWSAPYGSQLEIALARRPATDPARRLGALMVNPGGPGASAVTMALDTEFFSAEVSRRFDIVGIDPRGVGRSAPILCDQALVDAKPPPLPADEAGFARIAAANRRLAADCEARTGPSYRHADTVSVVRDMEAVRVALGEPRITFYGASYGTLIGQLYGEYYPQRLRGLVLDSVMDHSAAIGDFLGQATDAAQDSFDEFVAWCARDDRCVLRGRDIKAIWAELMKRAAAGTLVNPYDPPSRLRVWDLVSAAFSAFYDPQWYSFAYYLKDAYEPAPAGRRQRGQSVRRTPWAPAFSSDLTPYSFPAVVCQDWWLPVSGFADYRGRLRDLAVRAPQMLTSPLALTAVAGCLGWPTPPVNPQRAIQRAGGPVLLVNSRHDPATAYTWAQRVARRLGPAARLLTYDGWGHVTYRSSVCVSAAVDRYLTDLTLPAPGASCPAVEPEPYGIG